MPAEARGPNRLHLPESRNQRTFSSWIEGPQALCLPEPSEFLSWTEQGNIQAKTDHQTHFFFAVYLKQKLTGCAGERSASRRPALKQGLLSPRPLCLLSDGLSSFLEGPWSKTLPPSDGAALPCSPDAGRGRWSALGARCWVGADAAWVSGRSAFPTACWSSRWSSGPSALVDGELFFLETTAIFGN